MKKQIGFIGLGRMGSNMVLNLIDKKYKVIAYNRSPEPTRKLAKKSGVIGSYSIEEFVKKLPKPKIIVIMVTAGKPVESIIKSLIPLLSRGDIIIDGGNSYYENSIKRYKILKKKGIHFLDVGVSGGLEGARHGASLMIGGDKKVFKRTEQLFKDLATKDGYGYMGSVGSGHFVKGIHNGIEYGMMGALNEGFEAIKSEEKKFGTDLKEVAKVYDNGSIIKGRLTHWLWDSFQKPKYLDEISCEVPRGETEKEMKILERKYKMQVLKAARLMRVHTRTKGVCGRVVSALRNEFGGHKFKKK